MSGRARHLTKVLLGIGAGLLGVILLATLFAPVWTRPLLRHRVLPMLAERTGLEVHAEKAWAVLLPHPGFRAEGLELRAPQDAASLRIHELRVTGSLWALVVSGGQRIELEEIRVVSPHLRLSPGWLRQQRDRRGERPDAQRHRASEVRIASLEIVDGGVGVDELGDLLLRDVDVRGTGIGPGAPLSLSFEAAILADGKNASAHLELRPDGTLAGTLLLRELSLDALVPLLPGGAHPGVLHGTLNWSASLEGNVRQDIRLSGDAEMHGVQAQGLGPMEGGGSLHAALDAERNLRVALKGVSLRGPSVALTADASIGGASKRGRLDVRVERLELDQLRQARDPPKRERDLQPRGRTQQTLRHVPVDLTVAIERLLKSDRSVARGHLEGVLEKGVLRLRSMRAQLFGGEVDGAGTVLELSRPTPVFHLKLRARGIDAAAATRTLLGAAQLDGTISGSVDLAATGTNYASLRASLHGTGAAHLQDWALRKQPGEHSGFLRSLFSRKPLLRRRNLSLSFSIADAEFKLERPLRWHRALPAAPPSKGH